MRSNEIFSSVRPLILVIKVICDDAFIQTNRIMKLKGLLEKDTLWYFLAVVGLFLLLYLRRNFIIDTYIYALSLSTPIFILSYMLLKRIDALRYYLHATGMCILCSMV